MNWCLSILSIDFTLSLPFKLFTPSSSLTIFSQQKRNFFTCIDTQLFKPEILIDNEISVIIFF